MKITSWTDKIELSSQSSRQFIINSSRSAIGENCHETYFTWAAANALITNWCSPMKKVSFVPVISCSVANYSTTYSTLRNFEDMRKQLGQHSFPVISDEGMYQVIMDIVLSHISEFPNLFPITGIFYMAKVALHCTVVVALILHLSWKNALRSYYRINSIWRPLCVFLAWNTNHQGRLCNPEVGSILGRTHFGRVSDIWRCNQKTSPKIMFKSVKGCNCGIWWTVPNYQQNENWDGKIWECVFSKIWYVQIYAARFEVDTPGGNVGICWSRWQLDITHGSGGGTNASVWVW